MIETPSSGHPRIDAVLWVWFALTALAVAYVAHDQFTGGQEEKSLAMKVMRWGWVLLTLYTGVFGLAIYWFLHRASARETSEPSEPPLWQQSVESTIHCAAGDATGILLAAAVTTGLGLPMNLEVMVEYATGFAVGLFVFQALCMKSGGDGSYGRAVKSTLLAETLSMNALMAGMIPVMVILMSRDMSAMEPSSPSFWGTMVLAFVVGTVTAYPVNWWLVKRGLKHGMGGEARAARLCHSVSASSKLTAAGLTLAMLAGGIILGARYGDFSMRTGDRRMQADSGQSREAAK